MRELFTQVNQAFPSLTAHATVDCPDTHPFWGVGGQAIEPI
jgi:hypothetical protein